MARYTVIYDACILYPAPLRDLLIQLATANLFRAKWTETIHAEWMSSLMAKRKDLDAGRLQRTRELIDRSVPDCLVEGYEHLIVSVTLPDENDRHIVAAAIHARADAIVTFNLKDFPSEALAPINLEAVHPDEFIAFQVDLNDAAVVIAAQRCCRRLKKPPPSGRHYLDTLESQGLSKTVAFLRPYESVLGS
jgi:predicted nucleic acid-binding protein